MNSFGRLRSSGSCDSDTCVFAVKRAPGRSQTVRTNNGQDDNGGNRVNALVVRVRVRGSGRNTEAIGARIRLTSGSRTQIRDVKAGSSYLSQNDLRAHFGLGAAVRADRIEVDGRRVGWRPAPTCRRIRSSPSRKARGSSATSRFRADAVRAFVDRCIGTSGRLLMLNGVDGHRCRHDRHTSLRQQCLCGRRPR